MSGRQVKRRFCRRVFFFHHGYYNTAGAFTSLGSLMCPLPYGQSNPMPQARRREL